MAGFIANSLCLQYTSALRRAIQTRGILPLVSLPLRPSPAHASNVKRVKTSYTMHGERPARAGQRVMQNAKVSRTTDRYIFADADAENCFMGFL